MKPQRIVIVGATSGIATACARLWVAEGAKAMVLVARNADRLAALKADLSVREPGATIHTVETEFLEPQTIRSMVTRAMAQGPVDCVLIAHGVLPDQDLCERDLDAARDALIVNGLSPVLVAEAFAAEMSRAGHGTIIIIGSVAGDRGRRSNYFYGSTKALLERHAEGLRHRFWKSRVRILLVKPGPTRTPMTRHLEGSGWVFAPVEVVARDILRFAAGEAVGTIYTPRRWRLIMLIIRRLPFWMLERLNDWSNVEKNRNQAK